MPTTSPSATFPESPPERQETASIAWELSANVAGVPSAPGEITTVNNHRFRNPLYVNTATAATSSSSILSCIKTPEKWLRTSPLLKIKIGREVCQAVVDTGSAITVLATGKWPGGKLPDRSPWRLRSATGHVAPLFGPVLMPFYLNDNRVNFPVFIADISDECLLGADFLAQFQCHLSMADYSILLTLPDGSTTVLRCTGSSPSPESRRLVQTIRTTEAV